MVNKKLQGVVYLTAGSYNFSLSGNPLFVTQTNPLSNLVLQDVYLLCDTSGGAVDIQLPAISTFNNSWTAKIFISDTSNTASSGNITVNCFAGDSIDASGNTSLSISSDGGALYLQIGNENLWISSAGGSGGGAVDYKQSRLPNPSINPQSTPDGAIIGDAIDLSIIPSYPYIKLSNGNLASVEYCQSLLKSGILIYEAYDVQTEDEITGYWIAFKPNSSNPKLLEKVAQLKMTPQFWDNWYNYTLKRFGDNTVEYLTDSGFSPATNIQIFNTKLEFNPTTSTLTATDTNINLNKTYQQLFEELNGAPVVDPTFSTYYPEVILDDDYYGMMQGTQTGWFYYRNSGFLSNADAWKVAGVNYLTGQTRWINAPVQSYATVTNFDFSNWGANSGDWIYGWINLGDGLCFNFNDKYFPNNGNNTTGVTAIWSPYTLLPNQVTFINDRYTNGLFNSTNGNLSLNGNWYFDQKCIYVYFNYTGGTEFTQIVRFNLDDKKSRVFTIPNMTGDSSNFYNTWSNNKGLLFLQSILATGKYSGYPAFYYVTQNGDYYQGQSNNFYPTNLLKDKSYSNIPSNSARPIYNIFTEVDTYKGFDFDNN